MGREQKNEKLGKLPQLAPFGGHRVPEPPEPEPLILKRLKPNLGAKWRLPEGQDRTPTPIKRLSYPVKAVINAFRPKIKVILTPLIQHLPFLDPCWRRLREE